MRKLLGALAVVLGTVSILVTARYGFKQADELIDQWIAAVIFGSISLCAFIFDGLAVMLWFRGFRKGAATIAFIAVAAFVATFSNSMGGIVSRSDVVVAGRQDVADSKEETRAELKRYQGLLRGLQFTPTDEAAVKAATAAVSTAETQRKAECGDNGEKRGPKCEAKEKSETTARTTLATATQNKAATDAARGYEAKIETLKKELAETRKQKVGSPNAWAKAAVDMFGEWAAGLATWQLAAIALVFDLCLFGVMIGFTLLGEQPVAAKVTVEEPKQAPAPPVAPTHTELMLPPPKPTRPRLVPKGEPYKDDIPRIMRTALTAAKGGRVELGQCLSRYQAEGGAPCTPNAFMLCVLAYCKVSKIVTTEIGGKVYLLDVELVVSQSATERAGAQRLGTMGKAKRATEPA